MSVCVSVACAGEVRASYFLETPQGLIKCDKKTPSLMLVSGEKTVIEGFDVGTCSFNAMYTSHWDDEYFLNNC